jgi:hypothetical protein
MSDAEVMTAAIIAMLYFRGNFEAARRFLRDQGYIPNMLSKSRFNRRLNRIAGLFLTLFSMLGETWKGLNESSIYVDIIGQTRTLLHVLAPPKLFTVYCLLDTSPLL